MEKPFPNSSPGGLKFGFVEISHEMGGIRAESTKWRPQADSMETSKYYASHTYDLSGLSILCVDDNKNMHRVLNAMLLAMNIKDVQNSDDPGDAFLLMKTWMPDIIIADLEMPFLSGIEFIRRVRQAPDSPDPYVPIIVLSAHTNVPHIFSARDAGANAIIAKPVATSTLYSRLVRLIEEHVPFIKTKDYLGPDRRRLDRPYRGPGRRSQDLVTVVHN